MNTVFREYLAKGLFLGLWTYLALVHPDWSIVGRVLIWTAGGLAFGLFGGLTQQVLRGYRPGQNLPGFLLLVLLDSPFMIYLGLLGGLGLGLVIETNPPEDRQWLGYCALAGTILGFGFFRLTQVEDRFWRFSIGAIVGASIIYLALTYINELAELQDPANKQWLGMILLIGLPFFYLLTFCGEAEESEVEIAALCAGLGIGLFLVRLSTGLPEYADKLIFLIPLLIYFLYSTRVLNSLTVFKHTLRGYGNLSLNRVADSLSSFGRALQLDRKNELASRGLYQLHRQVDVTQLDPNTTNMLNFGFCLNVAESQLIQDRAPTEQERQEAVRMLNLVERNKPEMQARVDYLKAIANTHAKDFDLAAGYLTRVLDPSNPSNPKVRELVLLPSWNLALRLHPELKKRLGEKHLEEPGRRIDAIGAVERELAKEAPNADATELRRFLYATLLEPEFMAAAEENIPTDFNYEYVEQLGEALIADPDTTQRERGMSYLRIAGRGLPERGPSIFKRLAEMAEAKGDTEGARGYWEQVQRVGQLIGPNRLPADQKQIYLEALQKMVTLATAREDFETAVHSQRLYIEAGKEDLNSLRLLAELHANNGDVLNALLITERGLLYSKSDADLLAKKDSYYFSVPLERVRDVREKISSWFDVAYCVRKAKLVTDQKEVDADTLEWGTHLIQLARVIQPKQHSVMVTEARLLLRQGQRDAALSLLEDVREQSCGSGDEEDAWYLAIRLLADLYLNELERPDLAIECYNSYRNYQKSGADTLFQLGVAHEANQNPAAAIKAYEAVTAYEKHPKYWDAKEAVRRLKES